jgi:hypothetical protein
MVMTLGRSGLARVSPRRDRVSFGPYWLVAPAEEC